MDEMNHHRMPMLQEKAPSFKATTTQGEVNFPEDYKGKWVVFFSHPADFTPVCSTEFLTFGKWNNEFKNNNTELIGLSVDSNPSHIAWLKSLENINWNGISNMKIPFPVIEDVTMNIAKKYGMLQESASKTDTVRAVFIIDPEGIIRAILYYPLTNGRNIEEILRLVMALQTTDKEKVATPADWRPGDDVIMPNPKTVEGINRRYDQQNNDYYCLDWYLCFKKNRNRMNDQMPSPRRMETRQPTNQQMEPMPAQPAPIRNRMPMPAAPVAPNQQTATMAAQSDAVPIELEQRRNPHANIYDIALRESKTQTPPSKTPTQSSQAKSDMSGQQQADQQFTSPTRIERPIMQNSMQTSSGRTVPNCQIPAQPVFNPFPTQTQPLVEDIDTSHKIGIRF